MAFGEVNCADHPNSLIVHFEHRILELTYTDADTFARERTSYEPWRPSFGASMSSTVTQVKNMLKS